jgi:hypothetical protein
MDSIVVRTNKLVGFACSYNGDVAGHGVPFLIPNDPLRAH